jgi:hypothetical protein
MERERGRGCESEKARRGQCTYYLLGRGWQKRSTGHRREALVIGEKGKRSRDGEERGVATAG